MRRISLAIAIGIALIAAYKIGQRHANAQPGASAQRRIAYYADPMHPAYRSDKPGIAPDCGMPLQPVFAAETASRVTASAGSHSDAISIDPSIQQSLGIEVAPAEKSGTSSILRVSARVMPEDTRTYSVNSGVDGFVRSTYQDSVGTMVRKDQTLAQYYSPDYLAAASGFLAATERVPGSVAKEGLRSIQNYTDRLRNLGMSDTQIKHVAETRQLPESIDIVSPVSGFILSRSITPGQHFMHDTEFYRIADLSRVWIAAEVSEQDAYYLHPGVSARLVSRSLGRPLTARMSNSLPQSEVGGGTVKIRLEADNPGFLLRPETIVDVELPVRLPPAVTVPLDALIDSGVHPHVYVESSTGNFAPREVQTGWRSAERVEIQKGLLPGERVVVSATFLVDSESRMRSAVLPSAATLSTDRLLDSPQHLASAKTSFASAKTSFAARARGAGD